MKKIVYRVSGLPEGVTPEEAKHISLRVEKVEETPFSLIVHLKYEGTEGESRRTDETDGGGREE